MRTLILSLLVVSFAAAAAAQPFEYPAKYMCGRTGDQPGNFAAGQYFTSINVHARRLVIFDKRITVSRVNEKSGGGTQWIRTELEAGRSLQIDCRNILDHLRDQSIVIPRMEVTEGFVIIRSPVELDVVGVYTAGAPAGGVTTMHMERVPARKIDQ